MGEVVGGLFNLTKWGCFDSAIFVPLDAVGES